jgi:hypothetical protein
MVVVLEEAHRRALGARCGELTKLLRQIADLSVDSPSIGLIQLAQRLVDDADRGPAVGGEE